jgi:hypothetical protein
MVRIAPTNENDSSAATNDGAVPERTDIPAADVPLAPPAAEETSAETKTPTVNECLSDEARLGEIRQEFKGKAMSYFEMAKHALEYHDIKKRNFEQNDQKARVGRPGLLAAMARELEIPGKSDDAKLAWLKRALKVARLSPEAKNAAVSAKLERNCSALIEIAEAGGSAKQLQKIDEIEQRKDKSKQEAKLFLKKTVRFPVARGDEVLGKLISFADENGVEII